MAGVFAGDLPCWGRVALGSGSSQVLGGAPECGWNTASAACPGPCLTVRLCPCALRMWAPPGPCGPLRALRCHREGAKAWVWPGASVRERVYPQRSVYSR